MRDELHRQFDLNPERHLQDSRWQCDGKCYSEGYRFPFEIWPQGQYSPGYPQLHSICARVSWQTERLGPGKNCRLDQAILFGLGAGSLISDRSDSFHFELSCLCKRNAHDSHRFYPCCLYFPRFMYLCLQLSEMLAALINLRERFRKAQSVFQHVCPVLTRSGRGKNDHVTWWHLHVPHRRANVILPPFLPSNLPRNFELVK